MMRHATGIAVSVKISTSGWPCTESDTRDVAVTVGRPNPKNPCELSFTRTD